MDPFYLVAILAGAIGIGMIASNAAAQASAALPRVTSFSPVVLATPGLNGLMDLWVTALNGLSGNQMLGMIPNHRMIYIPAATVQAQPLTTDFRYTFTPQGTNTPFTILVPAAILQAYAAMPKAALQGAEFGYAANQAFKQKGITDIMINAGACSPTIVTQAINDAQYLLTGSGHSSLGTLQGGTFDNSNDKVGWLSSNAQLIAAVVNEVVTAITCATSGDQATLSGLQNQILGWAAKAGVASLTSLIGGLGSGGGGSSDQAPQDQPQQSQDVAPQTDYAPQDVAPQDAS